MGMTLPSMVMLNPSPPSYLIPNPPVPPTLPILTPLNPSSSSCQRSPTSVFCALKLSRGIVLCSGQCASPQDLKRRMHTMAMMKLKEMIEEAQDSHLVLGVWCQVVEDYESGECHGMGGCKSCWYQAHMGRFWFCLRSHFHHNHSHHVCPGFWDCPCPFGGTFVSGF